MLGRLDMLSILSIISSLISIFVFITIAPDFYYRIQNIYKIGLLTRSFRCLGCIMLTLSESNFLLNTIELFCFYKHGQFPKAFFALEDCSKHYDSEISGLFNKDYLIRVRNIEGIDVIMPLPNLFNLLKLKNWKSFDKCKPIPLKKIN